MSGGLDTKLCSYSIEEFARTRPSWIMPVAASGLVQNSSDYTTVAVKHRNRIDIWNVHPSPLKSVQTVLSPTTLVATSGIKRKNHTDIEMNSKEGKDGKEGKEVLTDKESESEEGTVDDDSRCNLSLRLLIKGPEHVHCLALSPNGTVVSCSTTTETRIWELKPQSTGILTQNTGSETPGSDINSTGSGSESAGIAVRKLILPEIAKGFCHSLAFSADGKRLAAYTSKGDLLLLTFEMGVSKGKEVVNEVEGGDDSENEDDEEENSDEEDEEEEDEDNENSDEDEDEDDKIMKKIKKGSKKNAKNVPQNVPQIPELQVKLFHSFDHSTLVSDYQRKSSKKGGDNSSVSSLSYVVNKIVFSADGMFLAIADAHNAVYIYDIDRYVCEELSLLFSFMCLSILLFFYFAVIFTNNLD